MTTYPTKPVRQKPPSEASLGPPRWVAGTPLHHAYQQSTAMTFLGMIAGQVGTAFAVRTQRASLWSVGLFTHRYLLAGIAAEIVLAGLFVYPPPMQALLGPRCPAHSRSAPTAALSLHRVGRRRIRALPAAPQASRVAGRGPVGAWRTAIHRRLTRSAGP